jgi:hypothetical protein
VRLKFCFVGHISFLVISEVVEALASDSPPDPNEVEDKLLYNFFVDNLPKAVQYAMELDVWLGAHLADLMQAEGLIPSTPMKKYDLLSLTT